MHLPLGVYSHVKFEFLEPLGSVMTDLPGLCFSALRDDARSRSGMKQLAACSFPGG